MKVMILPVKNQNNNENTLNSNTLLGHIDELRSRLVKVFIAFIVTTIIVYVSSHWWMKPFIHYIKRAHVTLHAFSFTEMIQIYIMIIFFVALCLIIPIVFYQLWALLHLASMLMNGDLLLNIAYGVHCYL